MNTKQIAEEAAELLRRLANDEFDWRDIQGTIQAAIEKATDIAFARGVQSERKWAGRNIRSRIPLPVAAKGKPVEAGITAAVDAASGRIRHET